MGGIRSSYEERRAALAPTLQDKLVAELRAANDKLKDDLRAALRRERDLRKQLKK